MQAWYLTIFTLIWFLFSVSHINKKSLLDLYASISDNFHTDMVSVYPCVSHINKNKNFNDNMLSLQGKSPCESHKWKINFGCMQACLTIHTWFLFSVNLRVRSHVNEKINFGCMQAWLTIYTLIWFLFNVNPRVSHINEKSILDVGSISDNLHTDMVSL